MSWCRKVPRWKWQTTREVRFNLPWLGVKSMYLPRDRNGARIPLGIFRGVLLIQPGYAWDGASGGIDTQTILRGSLVHDALYQLMREEVIPRRLRRMADIEFRRVCLEDGMDPIRAWWVYRAVRAWGWKSL